MADSDTTAPKPTWGNLIPRPFSTRTTTWNLAPFLSAPAVQKKSLEGKVNLLNIPQCNIASPLADNLSPRQVIDIRESLLGEDGESKSGGNGKEIWLSWKRTWDLWNNHYIEGRVNPVWVREEWARRSRAKDEWDRGRDERRRHREQERYDAAGGYSSVDPHFVPLRPLEEVPRPKPALEKNGLTSMQNLWQTRSICAVKPPNDAALGRPSHGHVIPGPADDDGLDDIIDPLGDSRMSFSCDDEEPSDSEPLPPPTTNPDGSSAGWWPMKELAEYKEPGKGDFQRKPWVDNIANTVWIPRRVGEKTLQIGMDKDIDEFKKTEVNVDGGVDCGRSPYPMLRPVTHYIRTQDGAFRKKKAWDGVTGIIFNLPTTPLEPRTETKDEKLLLIRDMYSDPFRDEPEPSVFPLDIRRVLKITPDFEKPRDLCEKGEKFVRDPALYPTKKYRHMTLDDPWWVEDSQKLARDAPPRGHPPEHESTTLGDLIPLDDELWKEETGRDLRQDAGYFVTNLHGATLIVNGMQIKKSDVAGPLPDFAIIQCPGGQIAFWWGVSGRHYGAGPEGIELSAKWDILRKDPKWDDHIGKTAGEVWDAKIKDRVEREKTGEEENDDEEWARYKRTTEALKRRETIEETPRQLGCYGPVPSFSNDDEELEWLFFQQEERRRMLSERHKVSQLIYPKDGWGGATPQAELSHELPKADRHCSWEKQHRNRQIMLQTSKNEKLAKEKAERLAQDFEKEKRRAGDSLESARKRRKKAEQERDAIAANEAEEAHALYAAKDYRGLKGQVESQHPSDATTMAAIFENSRISSKNQLAAFQEWKTQEAERLESQRLKASEARKMTGKLEVPPAKQMDMNTAETVKLITEEIMNNKSRKKAHKRSRGTFNTGPSNRRHTVSKKRLTRNA